MKRTQKTEAIRNIRRNRVSFLSIVIISMLAVTAYLGLSFSAEGLLRSADATYGSECFADIEINGTAALTEEDLASVRGTEGVTDAEGTVSVSSRVSNGTNTLDIVIRSMPERISLPHLTEGRLPQTDGECAVEETLARKMGYRTGDRVELTGRGTMTDAVIRTKAYTMTGCFTIADHLTEMISFEPMILVTREAFNAKLLPENEYTGILVRIQPDDPYRFSSAWKESAVRVKKRLEAITDGWMVTALHNTASYICTDEDAGILATVSVTFSMLFVVIAAMVIYSTISRLVEQDSRLVGAAKAMGLRNNEVFTKYLLFGAGGAVAGAAAGVLIAYFVFERIILFFFDTVFLLAKWETAFQTRPVIAVTAGAGILGCAAVFLACRRLMKSTAVVLMSGQNVSRRSGRKASGGGALYLRLVFRNMRTDWKRVLVSIVSIAGCCMLMVIGFSLKYAVAQVPGAQYDEIQRYDLETSPDMTAGPEAVNRILAVLEKENVACISLHIEETAYRAGEEPGLLTLICPDSGRDYSDYYRFTDPRNGKTLGIPESGVLITRMFAQKYDLDTGDHFLLYDSRMESHEAEVAGVFENYIGVNAVCSRAYAEECLGETLKDNTILIRPEGQDPEALREKLSGTAGFVSLDSARKEEALFNGISAMLSLIIVLLGALAVMIACFILLNLVSTYVSQKKNELTIMRINGYTTGETIRYASMECYGITLLGILIGLAAGAGFSSFLIRLIEQLTMSFVKKPVWVSFAASAAVTAVISGTVHYFAFRQIRGLKLSDMDR